MTERRSDVLIVGGGVLGLGHAIAAVRAGLHVTLCERHEVARGASVRNFGMVWPIGPPPGVDLQTALCSRELWPLIAAKAGFRSAPLARCTSRMPMMSGVCSRSLRRRRRCSTSG